MEGVKEKTENDKKELQISIDKDRDNFTRRLAEEHDQVRNYLGPEQTSQEKDQCWKSLAHCNISQCSRVHA